MAWILLYFGLVAFFYPSLMTYFVQDDFWLLAISRAHSLSDFLNFFKPLPDAVWYRPLSSQVFFFLGRLGFGYHPIPFHLIVFTTHFITAFFLYRLVLNLSHNKNIALVSMIFYAFHQLHAISLAWLSTYSFVVGPLVMLAVFDAYSRQKYVQSFIFFVVGILVTEVMIIVPLILLSYQLLKTKINLKLLAPYFLVVVYLIYMRFFVFPSEINTEQYSLSVSLKTLTTFKFYILRLIGIPLPFDLLPLLGKILIIILTVFVASFIASGFRYFYKNTKAEQRLLMWWGSTSLIGLAPFILLSSHIAPYYTAFSLVGFAPLIAQLIIWYQQKLPIRFQELFLCSIVIVFLLLQFAGNIWTYQTHWLFRRARLAEDLIKKGELEHIPGTEEYFSLGANRAKDVYK